MRKLISKSQAEERSIHSVWEKNIPNFSPSAFSKEVSIDLVFISIASYGQKEFYPLIAKLLTEIGFVDVRLTREGDTNNRMDALIRDDVHSIPIEIKSPTEIEYINIKAIRQAVENKIILQSRHSRDYAPSTSETSTLAIGYKYPESRSGVVELVEDFEHTFNIKVGYIDFKTLLSIHWDSTILNIPFNLDKIRFLKGQYK